MELQILPFAQPNAILVEVVPLVLVTIAADGVMKSKSVLRLPRTCLSTLMGNARSTKLRIWKNAGTVQLIKRAHLA